MKYQLTLIGGGHVLTKYLLQIQSDQFEIARIIGKSTQEEFLDYIYSNQDYPKYKHLDLTNIVYQNTTGTPADILKKIKLRKIKNEVILILTPPQTHFEILKIIVTKSSKKVYVEKPAVTQLNDYESLIKLMNVYKYRIYLAEQYAYGRAINFENTYIKHKSQLGKIQFAELYIEEGQKYFDVAQTWFSRIGPELDIGIHLLGVLFKILEEAVTYTIGYARKLNGYLINYGSESQLNIQLKDGYEFKVILKCGKRAGNNRRYIKLFCEKGIIWQKYTTDTEEDPVYVKINGKSKQLVKNSRDYRYYDTQVNNFIHWLGKPKSQAFVLQSLKCALEIREERLKTQQQFMNRKLRYVAMIPARMNSTRILKKNIKKMAGKPMLFYAIKAAINANIFDEIYVNSESETIGEIGLDMGVNFYKRNSKLAQDDIGHEEFVYDFLKNVKADYIFMIHANKPLINSNEIREFVKTMIKQKADSMFSVNEVNTHVFVNNRPVNFEIDKPYLRSEQLIPAQIVQWTITGWKVKTFLLNYQKKNNATFSGKVKLFPISVDSSLNVEQEKDFVLAEQILKLDLSKNNNDLQDIVSLYRRKYSDVLASLDLDKIREVIKSLITVYRGGGRIYVMGNGGSAATASHFAADLGQNTTKKKSGRVSVICLNDNMARITAIANDLGFNNIFVEQLYDVLKKNDLVLIISGSGNSQNLIEAVEHANEIGARTVGMLGFDGGRVIKLVNIPLKVASFDYTVIENTHMFICDVITNYFQKMLRTSTGEVMK